MKRIHLVLIAGLFASLVAGVASAGTPRIDRREARQHARIVQGRRSGALDRAEMARLRAGQLRVHRMEWRAEADGIITRAERRRIERAQDRQNRTIYRLKHNRWRA